MFPLQPDFSVLRLPAPSPEILALPLSSFLGSSILGSELITVQNTKTSRRYWPHHYLHQDVSQISFIHSFIASSTYYVSWTTLGTGSRVKNRIGMVHALEQLNLSATELKIFPQPTCSSVFSTCKWHYHHPPAQARNLNFIADTMLFLILPVGDTL